MFEFDLTLITSGQGEVRRQRLEAAAPWHESLFSELSRRLDQPEFTKPAIQEQPALLKLIELAAKSASVFAQHQIKEVAQAAQTFISRVEGQYQFDTLPPALRKVLAEQVRAVRKAFERFDCGLAQIEYIHNYGCPGGKPEYD